MTSPCFSASRAVMGCPVRIISMARNFPIVLVKRWVPPAPGIIPMLISGCPNFAVSEAMIMSQFIASSHPPPRACPLMAPTIGLAVFFSLSQSANWLRWMRSTGVASDSSLMSAPAEKASSFPVRTVALIRSSLSNASRASTSSLRSSKFNALRTLGLFRRMIPMGGSVSTTIWLNGKRDQFCRS